MISIRNIYKGYQTKKFGWKHVLNNISIDIPNDKSVGILGRNGAGKSTLIRMLSGVDIVDSGEIIIPKNHHISWPLGGGFGVSPQLTGIENIEFVSRIYGQDADKAIEYVEDFAELGYYLDLSVDKYSSGMKSRLAFGISMALDFDTYLVDEGFNAGDARFTKKSKQVFADKRKNANMIVVSHNKSIIKQFCDFAAVLHEGKLTVHEDVDKAIKIYEEL